MAFNRLLLGLLAGCVVASAHSASAARRVLLQPDGFAGDFSDDGVDKAQVPQRVSPPNARTASRGCGMQLPTVLDKQTSANVFANWATKNPGWNKPGNGNGLGRRHLQQADVPIKATIKVYVHVIRSSNSTKNWTTEGNVPNATIDAQMDVLRAAYKPLGYNFTLVRVDRTTNSAWLTMSQGSTYETAMKNILHKGTAQDLNIYLVRPGDGLNGWSTYPWIFTPKGSSAYYSKLDSVVLDLNTLPGGSSEGYNLGGIAVHEVGHWLGLYHTFEGGCDPDKTGGGDQVADTPAQNGYELGCPVGRDSCTGAGFEGADPVNNYMNYVDNACMSEFTPGQAARVDAMFDTYRRGQ